MEQLELNLYVYLGLALVTFVIGSARLVRLVSQDEWPPVKKFRERIWPKVVRGNEPWRVMVTCPWCVAPYVVAANGLWAWFSDLHWTWWVFNAWLALSYAASWVVFHDQDGIDGHAV